jgi:predicted trehalose synthase
MIDEKHAKEPTHRVKAALVAEWYRLGEGARSLEHDLAEQALAFGYRARAAFDRFQHWTDDLDRRLAAEWRRTEAGASQRWSKVRRAVKHGWDTAKAAARGAHS